MMTVDEILWYLAPSGVVNGCRVRVYRPNTAERAAGRLDVVIVSSVEEDTEMVLKDSAEMLAARLWKKLKRPGAFVYIEHRPARNGKQETFAEVIFQTTITAGSPFKRPRGEELFTPFWLAMTRAAVEELIGGSLEKAGSDKTGIMDASGDPPETPRA